MSNDAVAPPLGDLVSLAGRVAVVTGGAAGVGEAICARLSEAGAAVVVADVDVDRAATVAERLGGAAIATRADVSSQLSVASVADETVERFGRLDVWVNNAGIFPRLPLLEMTGDDWDRVHDVNLRGTFFGSQVAARAMAPNGATTEGAAGGVIVNVASASAFRFAGEGMAHYAASKAGVVGLTRSLAAELGPSGIRVLAVAPTLVQTPNVVALLDELGQGDAVASTAASVPLRLVPTADDVARVVLFAVSDLAALMTGSTLVVDGGLLST